MANLELSDRDKLKVIESWGSAAANSVQFIAAGGIIREEMPSLPRPALDLVGGQVFNDTTVLLIQILETQGYGGERSVIETLQYEIIAYLDGREISSPEVMFAKLAKAQELLSWLERTVVSRNVAAAQNIEINDIKSAIESGLQENQRVLVDRLATIQTEVDRIPKGTAHKTALQKRNNLIRAIKVKNPELSHAKILVKASTDNAIISLGVKVSIDIVRVALAGS